MINRHATKCPRAPSAWILACAVLLPLPTPVNHTRLAADEIELRQALIVPSVGRYGRWVIHEDAIESEIVAGTWVAPRDGEELHLPDGTSRKWETVAAAENGWFSHRSLVGGYAYIAVPSQAAKVMLLDAAGHSLAYVNGAIRMGDPYAHGYVRVPVQLESGVNHLLFHTGRGRLRAKLVDPKAAAQFDLADTTLPDLIVGESTNVEASVVVINCTNEVLEGLVIESKLDGADPERTALPALLPLSSRKVGFRLTGPVAASAGEVKAELKLLGSRESEGSKELDQAPLSLTVKQPAATHKRTFRSAIDGSVQYYAIVPARPAPRDTLSANGSPTDRNGSAQKRHGLVLTLHGAGVEAIGQANSYAAKPDMHIVAPTNRRPFGFDWEDWGRMDAIEVLELAEHQWHTDPQRTFLTGHSMGGHGVWHLAATYPDRFAAIGPSAGWVSFASYGAAGPAKDAAATPENLKRVVELLMRATSPSDTLSLAPNYAHHGVYVLHGEKDDNVPVDQARVMRRRLAEFHSDFAYHEEPGMGHWWGKEGISGAACVDWPPMFEFFADRRVPTRREFRRVQYITANPGISARSHWFTIEAQTEQLKKSSATVEYDAEKRLFRGITENVARLALDLSHLDPVDTIQVELDTQVIGNIAWPTQNRDRPPTVWLGRRDGQWVPMAQPAATLKGPDRYGMFKDAFRNHVIFIFGTRGNGQENAWSLAKARYDAERFWYQGNGSVDVISDATYLAAGDGSPWKLPDRNIVLYGNADTNAAWPVLMSDSPVQVRGGSITIGNRQMEGNSLACLCIRPKPGSVRASVGVVSGTGVVGMRLTDRIPVFTSGVAIPDCIVFDPDTLRQGAAGVQATGYFGLDWHVESGEFAWRD